MTRRVTKRKTLWRAFLARRHRATLRGTLVAVEANMPRAPGQQKKLCAVCDMHKSDCARFKSKYVGHPLWCALRLDHSHHRYRRIGKRERAGAFERVITHDDVICRECSDKHSSAAGVPRRKASELVAARAREDQRRLRLFLDVAQQSGHLPRKRDPPVHIAGWYLDARDAAKTVSLGVWLANLCTVRPKVHDGKSRLEMIRLHGTQPEAAALVEELEEWILEEWKRARARSTSRGDSRSTHRPRRRRPGRGH